MSGKNINVGDAVFRAVFWDVTMVTTRTNDAVDGAVEEALYWAVWGAAQGAVCDAVWGAVDGAVEEAVYWAVDGALYGAVNWAVNWALYGAVTGAVNDDAPHPGLQDFIAGFET